MTKQQKLTEVKSEEENENITEVTVLLKTAPANKTSR
jgi:hypothetical protein